MKVVPTIKYRGVSLKEYLNVFVAQISEQFWTSITISIYCPQLITESTRTHRQPCALPFVIFYLASYIRHIFIEYLKQLHIFLPVCNYFKKLYIYIDSFSLQCNLGRREIISRNADNVWHRCRQLRQWIIPLEICMWSKDPSNAFSHRIFITLFMTLVRPHFENACNLRRYAAWRSAKTCHKNGIIYDSDIKGAYLGS